MTTARLWGWLDPDHPDPLDGVPGIDAWLAAMLGLSGLAATPPAPLDLAAVPAGKLSLRARAALGKLLGEAGLSLDPGARAARSLGQSYPDQLLRRSGKDLGRVGDGIAFPRSVEDVLGLFALARAHKLELTAVGGATGVTGAIEPIGTRSWLIIDMSRMARVLEISDIDRTVRVQAGISLVALEAALGERGFTLGHFPQSFMGVTLGGALMANGSGQRSDLYGRMSDLLVSARIATPEGLWPTEAFRHAGAGPWLGGLVAGSEGLFGIVCDATLRIRPKPERVEDRGWLLPSFRAGVEAVRETAQAGHGLAMLRLSDSAETRFLDAFRLARAGHARAPAAERIFLALRQVPRQGNPALLIAGFEGRRDEARSAFHRVAAVLTRHGAVPLGTRPGKSWQRSRFAAPHLRESLMRRGLGVDSFETAVPWSKLATLHTAVLAAISDSAAQALESASGHAVAYAHLSHSYPEGACLYFTAIFPRANDALGQWRIIKHAVTNTMIAHGGSLSHHHGLGAGHAPWAEQEKSELGLALLAAIRGELDPDGIMATGAIRALRNRPL